MSLGRHKTKSPRLETMCVHRGSESVGNCTGLWMSGLQRLEARPVLSDLVIRRLKRCRKILSDARQTVYPVTQAF